MSTDAGIGHIRSRMRDGFPPHLSRRSLVRAALALPGVLLASGCSGRLPLDLGGNTMSDAITVESFDDAVSLALEQLAERHGEGFHLVDVVDHDAYEPGPGKVGYNFCLAPDASPERYFTAMVVAEAETGRLSHDVESNYSQWLFKERAEGPYRQVLERDEATVGFATSLFYTRVDARVWREDQLEEYMGDGGHNDPRVEAIAVLDAGIGREEAVSAIARIQEALWGLDGSMRLIAARRGANPREDWLYLTASPKQLRGSHGDALTEADVKDIEDTLGFHYGREDLQAWDGTATVGDPDPSHVGSGLPEVTWKR